jgi:glycosyltransferase involved in cell wall biosynthesis
MRVAIVHDYIKEFGGAERVLKTLSEIYPDAPIYTAFLVKNSTAGREFEGKKIHESFLAPVLKIGKLYSPLRFLAPVIWRSFDLSNYDLVITSCSWYITRGFKIGPKLHAAKDSVGRSKVIAYCHTPPRWLYGYEMSVGFTKYWPVKIYAAIVGHFIRIYDYTSAQKPKLSSKIQNSKSKITSGVDYFVANSKNVQARIEKFYKREATVIYPPVEVEEVIESTRQLRGLRENYFLIVSRLVGAKGLEEAAKAFRKLPHRLKIVGESHGFSDVEKNLKKLSGGNVELVGRVTDDELYRLYAQAKGFIALARDEDFGMTVVEAQAAGTPVIAFNGGGFRESVIDGETGILIDDTDEKTLGEAVKRFNKIKWDKKKLQTHAKKFSKDRFIRQMKQFIKKYG